MENSCETLERSERPRTYDVYFKQNIALVDILVSTDRAVSRHNLSYSKPLLKNYHDGHRQHIKNCLGQAIEGRLENR